MMENVEWKMYPLNWQYSNILHFTFYIFHHPFNIKIMAIIAITGIDGSMVMSESLPLNSGTRQLSLESLKAGSYLVQLLLNDKPAAIKRLQIIK